MNQLTRRVGLAVGGSLLLLVGAINGCSSDSGGATSSSGGTKDGGGDTGSSGAVPPPPTPPPPPPGDGGATLTASATLAPVDDAGVTGSARFTEQNGAVTVVLAIQNAAPGTHGMHVHNGTDCTNPGPHYGPTGGPYHGEWKITVDDAGVGALTVNNADITVSAGATSVGGHAIVFHKLPAPAVDGGADAGPPGPPPRQACGVIATP